ncbi:MAG TPA: twin-arginine translocation signal domain-containing protein, partial [Bryobacteraceae bacterium]|nr:twin-arginine translocation signal domain-containing protein [Bryobacteraceae bacterium]
MSETSRRGFLFAAGAAAAAPALAAPQNPGISAANTTPRRAYSMKLGVHMTNWQNLWRKGVISWEEIGKVSAQLGFHGIELQQDNVENASKQEL